SFYKHIPKYNDEYFKKNIFYLKNNKILTANFANFLYKITSLKFSLTDTAVGIQVRKILAIKSKTLKVLNNKNTYDTFKGYDLSYGLGFDIRKKIADRLISLKLDELDLDKICDITDLPKKLFKKII
ncbi:hypothetical protein Q6A89_09285, partial [Aliarcobacter skirrowii]